MPKKKTRNENWKDESFGNVVSLRKLREVQGRISLKLEMRTNNYHSGEMNTYCIKLFL
jgi:hypothetical protein